MWLARPKCDRKGGTFEPRLVCQCIKGSKLVNVGSRHPTLKSLHSMFLKPSPKALKSDKKHPFTTHVMYIVVKSAGEPKASRNHHFRAKECDNALPVAPDVWGIPIQKENKNTKLKRKNMEK